MGTENRIATQVIDNLDKEPQKGVTTNFRHDRESLSENFINELDGWARQAMALDGFNDY